MTHSYFGKLVVWGCAALALGVLAVAAYGFLSQGRPETPWAPSSFTIDSYFPGEEKEFTVEVPNPYGRDIVIDKLLPSCTCTEVAPVSRAVTASNPIVIKGKVKRRHSVGKFEVSIGIKLADEGLPSMRIRLVGRIIPPVEWEIQEQARDSDHRQVVIAVKNLLDVPVVITVADCSPSFLTRESDRIPVEPSGSRRVAFSLPADSVNRVDCRVSLRATFGSSGEYEFLCNSSLGNASGITTSPPELHFGAVTGPVDRMLRFEDGDVDLAEVQVASPGCVKVTPNGGRSAKVTLDPTQPGLYSGAVRLKVGDKQAVYIPASWFFSSGLK